VINSIFRDALFENRVALITGGGTGIGLRTARELSRLGATVVIASRKKNVLEAALPKIEGEGGKAHAIACNVRDEESIRDCVQETLEKTSRIDFLINNAGGQFPSPAEAIPKKGWEAVLETNLTGIFLMSQEVFKKNLHVHGGVIVNVIANMWRGFPMMSHTGAARAGVDNLTKSLANEWGRFGVRVNAVAPGIIQSSGLDSYDPSFKKYALTLGKFNQTYRLGTEAEVAAGIIFLLSPAASFITGETLRIDGGDSIYCPTYPPVENDQNPPFEGEGGESKV